MGKPSIFIGANTNEKRSNLGKSSLHVGLNNGVNKVIEILKSHTEIDNDDLLISTFGKKYLV